LTLKNGAFQGVILAETVLFARGPPNTPYLFPQTAGQKYRKYDRTVNHIIAFNLGVLLLFLLVYLLA